MINRKLENIILNKLKPKLVVGLFGPRRTGKTVLMEEIMKKINGKVLYLSGDDLDTAEIFSNNRIAILSKALSGYKYFFLDEAQKISNIGTSLKLIVDNIPDISVFITGSSSLYLRNKTGEPLTGRSTYYLLYPISESELNEDYISWKRNIESRLIFGNYPQIITAQNDTEKKEILESIKNGYLLRDILEIDNLKDSIFILQLLRLLAFQIGHDISYPELASNLSVKKPTVMRYLNLLEKSYIIFSLPGFSRNLRKEYSKTPRYFFYDNGIRNVLISNLNPINLRNDVGYLWENYCITERIKRNSYENVFANYFFWRTYDKQEIDLIEEREGKLFAFEFKWKQFKNKPPVAFSKTYPDSKFITITSENFSELNKSSYEL